MPPATVENEQASLSLLGQRAAINASVRTLADLAIVVRRWGRRDRRKHLVGLFAASRVVDALMVSRMARDTRFHRASRLAIDTARAYGWAGVIGDDVLAARSNIIASAVPHSLEAGFRLRASTDAVPVVDPSQPFPPSGPINWLDQLASVVGPVAVPAMAAGIRYRRDGAPTELNQAGWPALASVVGFSLAHERERTQASIRARWRETVRPWLQSARESGRVRAAVRSSPGHDFKKTLLALAALGSDDCAAAARSQSGRPASVLESSSTGSTLWNVCQRIGVWPEPAEAWATWVTREQETELAEQVGEIERRLGPGRDAETELTVTHADADRLGFEFRGLEVTIENRRPRPSVRLDPVAWSLLVSGALKGLGPIMAGLRPAVAGAGAAIDGGMFLHYVRGHPSESEESLVLGLQVLSAAVVNIGALSGRSHETGRSGEVAFASTMGTIGLFLTIGRYGPKPAKRYWSLLAVAVGLWSLGAARSAKREPALACAELAYLLMGPLATFGLDDRIEYEADVVEFALASEFRAGLQQSHEQGEREELEWFRSLLDLAEHELERLSPSLGTADLPLADRVRHDCHRMRTWLESGEATP